MQSLQTSVGSLGDTISTTCIDLYAERVMLPRIALFVVIASLLLFTLLRHRRRRTRQLARLLPKNVVLSVSTDDYLSQKRRFACFLLTTVTWITIFIYTFNASTVMPSTTMSAAQARPRLVFSFTTTTKGIDKIEPTVYALVHQEGDGFDIIYVIIPRQYRDKTIKIPSWLLEDATILNRTEFYGVSFAIGTSSYHTKLKLIVVDTDFGPASKVLGTLLVEQDPDTIIVYGDDDRLYPPQLSERVLYYTHKYPHDAIAVLGGWISAEDQFYCGRSIAVGVNSVSFVGGAGGVAVKRRFFGLGKATLPVFQVANLSKACFLGDDYYLSRFLSRNNVRRRIVSDSCWNIDLLTESFTGTGLSKAPSKHPGGANVEHYQQCIREFGQDQDLSHDGEFGAVYMFALSRAWGILRGLTSLYSKGEFVTC